MQNGQAFTTPAEIVADHEQWFKDPGWIWEGSVVHKVVGEDMAMALVKYNYRAKPEDSPVSSEDEEIPRAGLPKPRTQESGYGPSKSAFSAAPGSALAGAFTSAIGLGSGRNEGPRSHEVSEDESMSTDSVARGLALRKDLGNVASNYSDSGVVQDGKRLRALANGKRLSGMALLNATPNIAGLCGHPLALG